MAFIPLKPIPIKYRHSMIYVGIERIGIRDGTFVVIDNINVERMHISGNHRLFIVRERNTY